MKDPYRKQKRKVFKMAARTYICTVSSDNTEDRQYFVLGDNRNNSEDSRSAEIGVVTSDMIEGRAWFVLSPAEHRRFL